MINKQAEIDYRYRLYNACRGMLRIKQAMTPEEINAVEEAGRSAGDRDADFLRGLGSGGAAGFRGAADRATGGIEDFGERLGDYGYRGMQAAGRGIVNGVNRARQGIVNGVNRAREGVVNGVNRAREGIVNAGNRIRNGIVDAGQGIAAGGRAVGEYANRAAHGAYDGLRNLGSGIAGRVAEEGNFAIDHPLSAALGLGAGYAGGRAGAAGGDWIADKMLGLDENSGWRKALKWGGGALGALTAGVGTMHLANGIGRGLRGARRPAPTASGPAPAPAPAAAPPAPATDPAAGATPPVVKKRRGRPRKAAVPTTGV